MRDSECEPEGTINFRYTRAQRRREMGVSRFAKLRRAFFESHGIVDDEEALRELDASNQHSLCPAVYLSYLRTRFAVDAKVRHVYEVRLYCHWQCHCD